MTYEELLRTPEYCTTRIQIELFNKVEQFIKDENINRAEFAKRLGVSKGYISQILNGDYDHRLSKFVELAFSIGYKPKIIFEPIKKEKETFDLIEKAISDAQDSLGKIGYCAMIYKPGYGQINQKIAKKPANIYDKIA